MGYVITGGLNVETDRHSNRLIVEHWNRGGEVRYTITGGYRDVWVARFRRSARVRTSLQITYHADAPGFPDAAKILADAFRRAHEDEQLFARLRRFFVSWDATHYQTWNIALRNTAATEVSS